MNIMLNRLDPHVPDPVESRRRAAGRLVRIAYSLSVFGVLAFFVVYFGRPLIYLGGPGTVSAPRHVVSLPYTVQVSRITVRPGDEVKAGEEIGAVRSPDVDNIVATYMRSLADVASRQAECQSLVAGTPIAEIFHPTDVFVDWYIPNERFADPAVGNSVLVLFGNWRYSGTIAEILPVSDVHTGTHALSGRERTATQIARIRFKPGAQPPALNSTVYVHMHYTALTAELAAMLIRLFRLAPA